MQPRPDRHLHFIASQHDQGSKIVLSQNIPANGASRMANSTGYSCQPPNCAQLSAPNLPHFISDNPPAAAIQAGASAFQNQKGPARHWRNFTFSEFKIQRAENQTPARICGLVHASLQAEISDVTVVVPWINGQPLFLCGSQWFPDVARLD